MTELNKENLEKLIENVRSAPLKPIKFTFYCRKCGRCIMATYIPSDWTCEYCKRKEEK